MEKKTACSMTSNIKRKAKRLLIKVMLRLIGRVEQKEEFDGSLESVVILAQEKFGDAILLTPLLKNLRRALPDTKIHIVTVTNVYRLFEQDPNVDEVIGVKQNYLSLLKKLRNQSYDLLFNTKDHPSFTFLCLSRFIRARHRVGVDHPLHRGFFNHLVNLNFHQHVIEKNCSLLDYLGIEYSKGDCRPYLPGESVSEEVKAFVSEISGKELVGVNLSAGEKDRQWPVEKWVKLLNQIELPVMVFSAPAQEQDKHKLEEMFDFAVKSPTTRSIYEAGQIIRHLDLLISPDTSLIHVASCYATSVVGLYRADTDHIMRFYPYLTANRRVLSSTKRVEDISVEDVAAAVQEILERH